MRPDNAAELLEIMRERLSGKISNHTYAVPLFGVDMDGIDVVTLGAMKIVRSPVSHLTQSVSTGLACVLVYGGYNFVPEAEYVSFKKRVATLYDLRSRAVHGAAYHHVSERNVADLSQWVAWMLINMVSFVERGYTKIGQIKAIADRLDEKLVAASGQN